ncbi:ABC transporter ATP-binding protein [Roseitranquillus sediminis]|uniref:ABC transporter ATP-binding protein n=1 Tax=Roseitranquillus sediminis TaxID=2809051 RepID=UPI001D0CD72C|nr:ABC transporter ATP-binding protein [Roseitranquillus sediminis]MBM9593965.1 ABC transporter ATP-binding protein [Roseitranquillus sediminis]
MTKPFLETLELDADYGDCRALFGVEVGLAEGETVAVIGANGAGKSTLLRSIAGLVRNAPEMVRLDGRPIGALSAEQVTRLGISTVPQGRRLFPSLSVEENLLIGGRHGRSKGQWSLGTVYGLFPMLRERRKAPATALTIGQQQMAAIGRALMSNPRILLCDEIGLGLPPELIRDIYAILPRIREAGASVVLAEQDIGRALRVADRVYCLTAGRVTLLGRPEHMRRHDIHDAYFGVRA